MSTPKKGARAPSQRQLRVGEEVRHALAEVLGRGDFRDPEISRYPVTVTEVRMSPDLRNATAFVTTLGGEGNGVVLGALKRVGPYLRSQIAHEVRLQFAPQLSFQLDTSFDYATHIDSILHSEPVARDLVTPAETVADTDDGAAYDDDDDDDEPAPAPKHRPRDHDDDDDDEDRDEEEDEDPRRRDEGETWEVRARVL